MQPDGQADMMQPSRLQEGKDVYEYLFNGYFPQDMWGKGVSRARLSA